MPIANILPFRPHFVVCVINLPAKNAFIIHFLCTNIAQSFRISISKQHAKNVLFNKQKWILQRTIRL